MYCNVSPRPCEGGKGEEGEQEGDGLQCSAQALGGGGTGKQGGAGVMILPG